MKREGDNQKRGKADKAKLDSKGRPLATKAPEPEGREDGPSLVKVAVRLGCLLLLVSSQSGCEPEAKRVDEPAAIDSRVEAAVADAQKAAAQSRASSQLAIVAAKAANTSAQLCMGEAAK